MPTLTALVIEGPSSAVVGHDALNPDAEASKEAQGVEQEMQARAALFVGQDLRVGETGMIVDRQMHIFPADSAGLAPAGPIAGDPMADPTELAQLFDVDVEDLARGGPFVATDWLGRLERRQAIEAQPFEDAADGGGRNADLGGNLLAGVALPSQSLARRADGRRRLARR